MGKNTVTAKQVTFTPAEVKATMARVKAVASSYVSKSAELLGTSVEAANATREAFRVGVVVSGKVPAESDALSVEAYGDLFAVGRAMVTLWHNAGKCFELGVPESYGRALIGGSKASDARITGILRDEKLSPAKKRDALKKMLDGIARDKDHGKVASTKGPDKKATDKDDANTDADAGVLVPRSRTGALDNIDAAIAVLNRELSGKAPSKVIADRIEAAIVGLTELLTPAEVAEVA